MDVDSGSMLIVWKICTWMAVAEKGSAPCASIVIIDVAIILVIFVVCSYLFHDKI